MPFLIWAAWGGVWPKVLTSLSSGSSLFSSILTLAVPLLTSPLAQPGVLWRPRAHNSGCAAAAAHHWGHGHHLEAAPGPHLSLF